MRTILFLCTGNYYRSRFAEAVFNHEAERRALACRAISRGLAIHLASGDLSSITANALEKRGISLSHTGPTRCGAHLRDFTVGHRVIALDRAEHHPMMQRLYPHYADGIEYWEVPDVPVLEPEAALGQIEERVHALLGEPLSL